MAAVVLATALAVMAGCTRNGESFRSYQLVNAERDAAGVAPLVLDQALIDKAQGWAETLAASGDLRHSSLTQGVPDGWRTLAENVGVASGPDEAHALLMASSGHRANIVDGRSNRVGVGAAWAGGRLYVVQVFGGY